MNEEVHWGAVSMESNVLYDGREGDMNEEVHWGAVSMESNVV